MAGLFVYLDWSEHRFTCESLNLTHDENRDIMTGTRKARQKSQLSEKDILYYERVRKHLEETKNKIHYSLERIDLLVISISGATIYIVFETLKFMYEQHQSFNTGLLIASGIITTFAIICNFISQWTGFLANKHEANHTEYELVGVLRKKKKQDILDQEKSNRSSIKFGFATAIFNGLSTLLMIIGISFLVAFNLLTF